MLRVLEFALELGIAQAVLKGDSKVVMNALAEVDVSLSSYGLLIEGAKSFPLISVNYVTLVLRENVIRSLLV